MPKTYIELLVNDEPREFLAAPGATLLSALREELGLTAAKRGCAQGTCGTCTCVVDGEAVMSCLVPVETIQGADVRTLEGVARDGGELDELQAAFLEGFATQCGFCTSGMIMAAQALLASQPGPEPRGRRPRDLGQRLPLHGLRVDHQRDPRRRAAPQGAPAGSSTWREASDVDPVRADRPLLLRRGARRRLRRHRHAGPALRRARPRHRPHGVLRGPQPARPPAPQDGALRAPPRAAQGGRRRARARRPRRGQGAHARRRAGQLVHDPPAHRRRAERRAGAARGPRALQGRADRRRDRHERAGRAPGRPRGEGHLRGPPGRARRRGGARRRRHRDQAARDELLRLRGPPLPADPLRRRRRRLRGGRPRLRVALPVLADRARADRDDGLHRHPAARRPAADPLRHAGLLLHARQHGADPRGAVRQAARAGRHGRRRLRRQGRRDARADRLHRGDGDEQAGQVRLRPRGGDAGLLAARGRADLHQGRRDGRRPDRRPQDHALRRRRRLLAPLAVRDDEGGRAHAGAVRDPQRVGRRALRLHQPHAVERDARLRRDDRRLRAGEPDGPDRAGAGARPARAALQERLPRRRHEGAPQDRRGHGADRGHAARGRAGRPRADAPSRAP